MITNFKIYEKLNIGTPKIGNYVICEEDINKWKNEDWYPQYLDMIDIIKNKVGRIISIDRSCCRVEYDDIPEKIRLEFFVSNNNNELKCRLLGIETIKYWSKNIRDFTTENINFYTNIKNFNL